MAQQLQSIPSIPIGNIVPSKSNTRQRVDKAALDELTASIKAQGIINPLIVRPVNNHFEIVAGERRFRAAKAAGLTDLPAIIRELTDQEAAELAIIDNLQREDIHPLDEAVGFLDLSAKQKIDAGTIAAKVGKSRSYVLQRMKLNDLSPQARNAYQAGKLELGHALEIAKLQEGDQKRALAQCTGYRNVNVDQLRTWIREELMLQLSGAPWKKDDVDLVPEAGSCKACPKRTGANRDLFGEGKDDRCTDPICYQKKLTAFLEIQRKDLREKKTKFVEISTSYSVPREMKRVFGENSWKISKKGCKSSIVGLVVHGDNIGQLKRVCVDSKCKACLEDWQRSSRGSSGHYAAQARAARKKTERERRFRQELFRRVADKAPKKLSHPHLRMVAQFIASRLDYDSAKRITGAIGLEVTKSGYSRAHDKAVLKWLLASDMATAKGLYMVSMCRALDPNSYTKDAYNNLLAQAKLLGIKPDAVRRDIEKTKPIKPKGKKR